MQKTVFPLLLLPLLGGALFSCNGNQEASPVSLRFGTMVGNTEDELITGVSQLHFIKKSKLTQLIQSQENFLLLLHGSSDTCTCFTSWHDEVLAPYIKRHRLYVRAITLTEFESDGEYYGLKRVVGADTLAVFQEGKLAFQKCIDVESDPFVTSYAGFAEWMGKRVVDPKIFYLDEELLQDLYHGNTGFTIYFGRDTCGDCGYLNRTALRDYLDNRQRLDERFYYFDLDAYRPTRDDPDYDTKMAHYQEIKDQYGLSWNEDNPAGYDAGAVPSIFYVNPDGIHYSGDVIEAAGVFYNESIDKEGHVQNAYFTKARYEEACDTYLSYVKESNLAVKWMDELTIEVKEGEDRRSALATYEVPLFNALLDYAIAP